MRMAFFQRENAELASLSSCELIESGFSSENDYSRSLALDYMTEVSEHLLPPHEPNERFFRLLAAVLDFMHQRAPGAMWTAITYFSLWATRLSGFLPDLETHPDRSLSASSRELAAGMLRQHIADLPARAWNKDTALDLRRLLIRQMEEHVERRFRTPALLEAL